MKKVILTYFLALISSSDPDISKALFETLLATYDLPFRLVNVNEYATANEQTPSGYAF